MIEGIKLTISSAELQGTLQTRVEYHSSKAQWFDAKAKELGPELAKMNEQAQEIGKYTSNRGNAVDELTQKAAHHKDRATLFKFMAEHIIPNETYLLQEADLTRLEVIGGRW